MKTPTNRDTGMGVGKGDKPRHKLNDQWRANFDEIFRKKTAPVLGAEQTPPQTKVDQ